MQSRSHYPLYSAASYTVRFFFYLVSGSELMCFLYNKVAEVDGLLSVS